jgi:hypothetical protein
MRPPDPATKLRQLQEASERISANLVDLEIDSGKQLLEARTLEGRSAARWAEASSALTELWRRHGLLQELLRRADDLRGSRHAAELAALLGGQSIELGRDEVPLAERQLLGGSHSAERSSPDQLLIRMSSAFDQVKAVMSEIGGAWEVLIPKLDDARRAAADASRLAEEIGEPDAATLRTATNRLNELSAKVSADPLTAPAREIEQLTASLQTFERELESAASLKRGFERRLLEARERLSELQATVRECAAAREELIRKIVAVAAAPDQGSHDELGPQLAAITELAGRGAWREAAGTLDAWTARVQTLAQDATIARDANRAPVQARNQFRSLLEAYRVKAKRLGRVEDPRLAELFAQAEGALYTAPTDLARAAQLVRSYQEALGTPTADKGAR